MRGFGQMRSRWFRALWRLQFLESCQLRLCVCPPQSCVCAPHHVCLSPHTAQLPVKASFSAEKGAVIRWKSWNADCWVTPPWPTSSPWPEKLVGKFGWREFFFFLPLPPLSGSLSNTDMNTGPVQLLFPQCTQYIHIPQRGSSVRQVDNRHPLVQTAALSAEPGHFAQRRVLPQGRLGILQEKAHGMRC